MRTKPAVTLFVLSLAALAVALVPAVGFAAKGGSKPGGSGTSAVVTASPNPAAANGAVVELHGCGYDMWQPAEVHVVHSAGYTEEFMVTVWNPGCLNTTRILTAESGIYTIEVYQSTRKGSVLKASTVLTIQ